MRQPHILPIVLALCLLLTGCAGLPTAREMGDMALLRTLGVDPSPAGVAVTGSTGPRARGLQGEGEAALTLEADQASLSAACLAMQGQTDSYVFFGYVDQLLIGQALAEEGVRPVLDYFSRNAELGLGAQLWLVRGAAAREALSTGGDQGIDARLETLQKDGEMGIANLTRTAGEVYADLLELGCAYAPALSPAGDAALMETGYGILKGDALAGFLEGQEARGLDLLVGGSAADIAEVELPDNRVSVKITSASTKSRLEFQGNVPTALNITCKIEARLSEYQERPVGEGMEALQTELERQERACLEAALKRLRAWGADCAGLGARAAMTHPAQWRAVQGDWSGWFSRVPVEILVEVRIL
jgi:Ger(x)C family germination protein